jgi:hypothetical protein
MDAADQLVSTFPHQFWYHNNGATVFAALVRLHLLNFPADPPHCSRTDVVRDSLVAALRIRRFIAILASVSDLQSPCISDSNRAITVCNTIISSLRAIILVNKSDPSFDPCIHYSKSIDQLADIYDYTTLCTFYPGLYESARTTYSHPFDLSYGFPFTFPDIEDIDPRFVSLIELPVADISDDSAPVDASLIEIDPNITADEWADHLDPLTPLVPLPSPSPLPFSVNASDTLSLSPIPIDCLFA